jgi:hypothetical protein
MIVTDLSKPQEWIAARGFNNSFTITATLSGSAFDLSAYTFTVNFRRIGGTANVLQLTQGSGITNGGASGIVTILLTAANSQLIDANSYFYEIDYTVGGLPYRLLHGTFNLISEYNGQPTTTSVSIPINLAGTDVNLAVSLVNDLNTRTVSATTTATLTPNVDSYDMAVLTAQASALTIANPTGTPVNGNVFVVRIKDNGTARALTFGDKYRAIGSALATTTTISKTLYFAFAYNSADDKFDVFPSQLEV